MSRFQYSSALGDGSSLFAPRSKMSATAAALIGGGVALASGLANLWNQADTNKANREINDSLAAGHSTYVFAIPTETH